MELRNKRFTFAIHFENKQMKKLELKHFAPYLQYKPSVLIDREYTREIIGFVGLCEGLVQIERKSQDFGDYIDVKRCKLILRPLSDLTNEIDVNGEKFVPYDNLKSEYTTIIAFSDAINKVKESRINEVRYGFIQKLLEWHFDVFWLIEQGLAVDYNSLQK